jgi:hypothetical protein
MLSQRLPFGFVSAGDRVSLARLLKRPVKGIFIVEYEQGGGDVLFRVACNMGLEGIVSKRLDRAYGAGRCKYWIKIKNPAHLAYSRVRDHLLASLFGGPITRPLTEGQIPAGA